MGEPQRWLQDAPESQDAVIKLWQPGSARGGFGGLSLEMTLSEFVEAYVKPVFHVMKDSRPRTLEELDQSVKYWARFTGDPPLGAITVYHCRDYIVGLKGLPGRRYSTMGNNTIRKHAGAIQSALDLCAPAGRHNPDGVGLFETHTVPHVRRPPKGDTQAEDTFTLDELMRLIANADAATLPKRLPCSAATYHRRIYVFDFNTGMRPIEFMGATWRNYHGDHLILQARVGTKGRRDRRVELNEAAQQIIESNRGYDAERIFPWPREWPTSKGSLYKQHAKIAECLPRDRRFAYKGIRRLHVWELVKINAMAAQKSVGHTTAKMTIESYTTQRVVAEAVAELPAVRTAPDSQKRLFE